MTDVGSITKMKRTVEGIDTNSFKTKGPNLCHLCVIRMLNCHKGENRTNKEWHGVSGSYLRRTLLTRYESKRPRRLTDSLLGYSLLLSTIIFKKLLLGF